MNAVVRLKPLSVVGLLSLTSVLTGCTLATSGTTASVVPGVAFSGTLHGGQQAVAGARVYLLAVNPGAYGGPGIAASAANASISLLKASSTGNASDTIGSYVITDIHGLFNITGDYSCTSGFAQGTATAALPYSNHQTAGAEQVYLYALGGTATGSPTHPNAASGFLSALGPCSDLTSASHFEVNEITTAATAYTFAGFATDGTHIGSSGSSLAILNLANAFANIAQLVDTTAGLPTPSSTSVVRPVAALYTIADILGACINTTGPTGSSPNCSTLLAHTKSAGDSGTAATDTAAAAINLAHNPLPSAAGVTALFGLIPGTGAAFSGAYPSQRNDFTIFLQFSGNSMIENQGVGIDSTGNVWAVSQNGQMVSKFSNSGAALFASAISAPEAPRGLAVDTAGSAWIALQTGSGNIAKFSSSGTEITGSGLFVGGGISQSYGVAIDASGNAWYANQAGGKVSEFTSTGTPVFPSGISSPDASTPTGIAIDAAGSVWVTNYRGGSVSKFNSSGTVLSGTDGYTGGGMGPGVGGISIAIDPAGNAWTANFASSTVSEFSSTGTPLSGTSGYSGGGINSPTAIAVDSAGTVWICNAGVSSLTALASNGTPLSGTDGYVGDYRLGDLEPSTINQPYFLAIDGAGNVWVSNYINSTLSEMIGGAAPVVTPLAANLVSPYGTAAVNLP